MRFLSSLMGYGIRTTRKQIGLVMNRVGYTEEFEKWLEKLRDLRGKSKIIERIDRFKKYGALGKVETVGHGIFEFKIDSGPGYRVYYTLRERILIILCGGDKSTQKRDVKKAEELASHV